MKIIFTGGGTAGHIFPIVAIIRELKRNYPQSGFDFFYIGPKDGFANEILSKEGVTVKNILAGKIRRYFSFWNITDILFKLPVGIFQSFYHIFVISPDLIFSKGGYGSIPVVIAGWVLQAPIFLHESDISPGLANRIAGKFAWEIFTAFPIEKTEYFSPKKMICSGNPVRKEILYGSIEEAAQTFKLIGGKPVIFFVGGSQGAQKINNALLVAFPEILRNFEIIHQTGVDNYEELIKEAEVAANKWLLAYYHPFPFLSEKEISLAYAVSDIIVSRAGAGSIFEMAAATKSLVLVPLSGSAQDHQMKNAYFFAGNGACEVWEEANLKPHFIIERLKYLISRPDILKTMAKRAREISKPDAAQLIANYIYEYLTR